MSVMAAMAAGVVDAAVAIVPVMCKYQPANTSDNNSDNNNNNNTIGHNSHIRTRDEFLRSVIQREKAASRVKVEFPPQRRYLRRNRYVVHRALKPTGRHWSGLEFASQLDWKERKEKHIKMESATLSSIKSCEHTAVSERHGVIWHWTLWGQARSRSIMSYINKAFSPAHPSGKYKFENNPDPKEN
ncbi:hypothetical protein MJO28_003797 [Puccinia striiformis f. sp. tritici]|uniref:Uncharacterized protein n=1 Tax=Puccinia striiformis f. sp. tritici TaxID=168172 RepID=A0ACC0EM81_9BASI|nr:hypothetical protein MJO28_003797 [Puccinia striiformis f. sp. tritici]KAI7964108.1 hypothetical protein MJO29_004535 [Puccinia striiformis f. sp. tritici]